MWGPPGTRLYSTPLEPWGFPTWAEVGKDVCAEVSHLAELRVIRNGVGLLPAPVEVRCVPKVGLDICTNVPDVCDAWGGGTGAHVSDVGSSVKTAVTRASRSTSE